MKKKTQKLKLRKKLNKDDQKLQSVIKKKISISTDVL